MKNDTFALAVSHTAIDLSDYTGHHESEELAVIRQIIHKHIGTHVEALHTEIRLLLETLEEAAAVMSSARSDIIQTARVNQGNIDGTDICCPGDAPVKSRIGHHFVHQNGVNQSLALVKRIEECLYKIEARVVNKEIK